jgi:hypothetical protein
MPVCGTCAQPIRWVPLAKAHRHNPGRVAHAPAWAHLRATAKIHQASPYAETGRTLGRIAS